jgi:hypothetical protein
MNKILDIVTSRFNELEKQMRAIQMRGSRNSGDPVADPEQFYSWASSALYAIQSSFGIESPHYTNFQKQMSAISHNNVWSKNFSSICGVFMGAKNDIDSGYLFDLERSVSGEVFGDFITTAKMALTEGHHTVATVLACAALEDALKRYAISQGLNVEGQTMESVVNALKGKGLVSGAQKTLLSVMPKVRNNAMHADWDKLTPQDAGSVIGFVEQFLLVNF